MSTGQVCQGRRYMRRAAVTGGALIAALLTQPARPSGAAAAVAYERPGSSHVDHRPDATTLAMREAYGRAASAAACALRSLAAATICLALVIFWVDLTELIRPLSSLSEATLSFSLSSSFPRRRESSLAWA